MMIHFVGSKFEMVSAAALQTAAMFGIPARNIDLMEDALIREVPDEEGADPLSNGADRIHALLAHLQRLGHQTQENIVSFSCRYTTPEHPVCLVHLIYPDYVAHVRDDGFIITVKAPEKMFIL